jgi:hypothetical protein
MKEITPPPLTQKQISDYFRSLAVKANKAKEKKHGKKGLKEKNRLIAIEAWAKRKAKQYE